MGASRRNSRRPCLRHKGNIHPHICRLRHIHRNRIPLPYPSTFYPTANCQLPTTIYPCNRRIRTYVNTVLFLVRGKLARRIQRIRVRSAFLHAQSGWRCRLRRSCISCTSVVAIPEVAVWIKHIPRRIRLDGHPLWILRVAPRKKRGLCIQTAHCDSICSDHVLLTDPDPGILLHTLQDPLVRPSAPSAASAFRISWICDVVLPQEIQPDCDGIFHNGTSVPQLRIVREDVARTGFEENPVQLCLRLPAGERHGKTCEGHRFRKAKGRKHVRRNRPSKRGYVAAPVLSARARRTHRLLDAVCGA